MSDTSRPTLRELTAASFKIGCLGFGGPAGQIALMHRSFIDERKWIDEAHYLHALNYCMLLPGPEAQQLAIYVGWLLQGVRGGLIAGALFVLPGAAIMLALSWLYALHAHEPLVAAAFYGIKAAVLALVVEALVKIGRRALRTRTDLLIALGAFSALFLFGAQFPLVIIAAALIGLTHNAASASAPPPLEGEGAGGGVKYNLSTNKRSTSAGASRSTTSPPPLPLPPPGGGGLAPAASLLRGTLLAVLTWGGLWLAPLAIVFVLLGPHHVLTNVGILFSKLALVTFGGAYAVLAYLQQEAVSGQGWLTPGQMIDGLGLAETTPGPLILVNQFVGFLAGWRGGPWLALTSAAMALWCTFAPCFLWIFAGAPYAERLRHNNYAARALTGITAAVLGVIANLALWFGAHVLFARGATITTPWGHALLAPEIASFDAIAAAIALAAGVALIRFRMNVVVVVVLCALAGMARLMLG